MSISSLKRRSSCPDLQRLNAEDLNSISKVDVSGISGFPCLMLLKEDGGCAIYIPGKGKVYSLGLNFSGFELLANSGCFKDLTDSNPETPYPSGWMGPFSIAVTRAGEVLVVKTDENMKFRIFKNVPNPDPDRSYIVPPLQEVGAGKDSKQEEDEKKEEPTVQALCGKKVFVERLIRFN
ncbi:unnamed protein product [Cochlearia groenlandica]